MKRKLFLFYIFLIGLCFNTLAQTKGHISGTVKDAETNESLVGVSIYVEQLKQGTTTNERGHYEIDLPLGEHILRVSYVGYGTLEKKVHITAKPQTINMKLHPETETLSEVEVDRKSVV